MYVYTCACACVHPLYIRIYSFPIFTQTSMFHLSFCYPPWGSFGFLFIAHWLRSSPVGGDHFFHDVEYHSYTISTIISTINGLMSGKNYSKAPLMSWENRCFPVKSHRKTYNLPPTVSLASERGFSGLLEASTKRPTGDSKNRFGFAASGAVKHKRRGFNGGLMGFNGGLMGFDRT